MFHASKTANYEIDFADVLMRLQLACDSPTDSSLGWQSGSWTLTKKQESHLASWLHARMLDTRREATEDIGSYWMRCTEVHEAARHLPHDHVPNTKTQNVWSHRTTRRHAHRSQDAPLQTSAGGDSNRKIGK